VRRGTQFETSSRFNTLIIFSPTEVVPNYQNISEHTLFFDASTKVVIYNDNSIVYFDYCAS